MKNSYLTVTDQFCGAGGSSQGVRRLSQKLGGGIEVKLALNHWRLAIETHNTNFPETQHDCVDIAAVDPRRYRPTDILITSPECTNHSVAKGGLRKKPQLDMFMNEAEAAERSRATMWDVPRFAEFHKYNIIVVENVVDAKRWNLYPAWIQAMQLLGYEYREVFANSMFFFPTPQSRDRMYVVFWRKGNPAPDLNYYPLAFCPKCQDNVYAVQHWKNPEKRAGRYKFQYIYRCPVHYTEVKPYYYAAFNCIDWSNIGTRIGDRKKSLAENTMRRIRYGLEKFGKTGMPLHINIQQASGDQHRVKPVFEKLPTITTNSQIGILTPFVVLGEHSKVDPMVRSTAQPLQTQATRQTMGLVVPPFIIELNRTGKAQGSGDPLCTVTAGGNHHGLVMPFLTANYSPGYSIPINDPTGTITTSDHHGVVTPPFVVESYGQSNAKEITDPISPQMSVVHHGIVTTESFNSFITHYYGAGAQNSDISDPIGTASTKQRYGLVSYQEPNIEDCYYRMLVPGEIKLAMAFDPSYVVLGNANQQVRQLGNAVTPPVMEWIIEQCVKTLN